MQDQNQKIELLKKISESQAQLIVYRERLIHPLVVTYRHLRSGLRIEIEMIQGYLKHSLIHRFLKVQLRLSEVRTSWIAPKDN